MAQYMSYDWVFTANAAKGSSEEDAFIELIKLYQALISPDNSELKYAIVKGEYVSNYHLQGYVQFHDVWNKRKVVELMRELSGGLEVYVAKMRGTSKQAIDYVKKLETTWEMFQVAERGDPTKPERPKSCRSHLWEHTYDNTKRVHTMTCKTCSMIFENEVPDFYEDPEWHM